MFRGEEVDRYFKGNETFEEKNARMYVEVRYAKNTSLRLKHNDELFRGHKKLTDKVYAENLMIYLGNVRKTSNLSTRDLFVAISKMTGCSLADTSMAYNSLQVSIVSHDTSKTENEQNTKTDKQPNSSFKLGEPACCCFLDRKFKRCYIVSVNC